MFVGIESDDLYRVDIRNLDPSWAVVVHAYNSSTPEAEARRISVS